MLLRSCQFHSISKAIVDMKYSAVRKRKGDFKRFCLRLAKGGKCLCLWDNLWNSPHGRTAFWVIASFDTGSWQEPWTTFPCTHLGKSGLGFKYHMGHRGTQKCHLMAKSLEVNALQCYWRRIQPAWEAVPVTGLRIDFFDFYEFGETCGESS